MSAKQLHIQFGSRTIGFDLRFTDRKKLAIKVLPDQRVEVVAPLGSSEAKVLDKVRAKAPWILSQQASFERFEPRTPPRRYLSGETHRYLGRQYRLKVHIGPEEPVKLRAGYFHVTVPEKSAPRIRHLLEAWYLEKAQVLFPQILDASRAKFKSLPPHYLHLQAMPTRWGSCSPKGRITLNPELVRAPRPCIEYVVVHELCHLLIPSHGPAFFQQLEKVLPDWRKWKARLEAVMV